MTCGQANANERRIDYLDFSRDGDTPHHTTQGPQGSTRFDQEAEKGVKGELRPLPLLSSTVRAGQRGQFRIIWFE
jgi:hypothetical protein